MRSVVVCAGGARAAGGAPPPLGVRAGGALCPCLGVSVDPSTSLIPPALLCLKMFFRGDGGGREVCDGPSLPAPHDSLATSLAARNTQRKALKILGSPHHPSFGKQSSSLSRLPCVPHRARGGCAENPPPLIHIHSPPPRKAISHTPEIS